MDAQQQRQAQRRRCQQHHRYRSSHASHQSSAPHPIQVTGGDALYQGKATTRRAVAQTIRSRADWMTSSSVRKAVADAL